MNHSARRRLLVANFFPATFPPRSGGEQRYFHLYEHLSKHYDVTLLSTTYADHSEEFIEHSPTFREYRVPKHPDASCLHVSLAQRGIGPECSGYVVALLGAKDGAYGNRFSEFAQGADAIIHECPFTVPYDRGLGNDGVPRIYNAYNVEADLAAQMMQGEAGIEAAEFIGELEAHLVRNSALVFACSENDRRVLAARYAIDIANVRVVPNGFDDRAVTRSRGRRSSDSVVFLGSQHPPNVEALEFIANKLAPAMPDVSFEILGGVCQAYHGKVAQNLRLRGFVDAHEKSKLLSMCGAAINPLFSGAGTNLKMLDYMAHGAPVVSTETGARGLGAHEGEHLRISAADSFRDVLASTIGDAENSLAMGERARVFAEARYSWASIATYAAKALEQLWQEGSRRRRLVWLCDYPVASGGSGGQVRARHLLVELGREFEVTLICLTQDMEASRTQIVPGVVQVSIPKTDEHRSEELATSQGEWISVADIVATRFCLKNRAFVAAFTSAMDGADLVGFEQCYLAPMLAHVPAGTRIVYSSQNNESTLKRQVLAPRGDADARVAEVETIERTMLDACELVIAVSDADAQAFAASHPELPCLVVENGVTVPPSVPARREWKGGEFALGSPLAVFVGSGHPPNARAARFIANELAPQTPNVVYAIVGSVCDALRAEPVPCNVLLLGFLADDEKRVLLEMADIAVNPLFEGGGSSLKVPDFFASGLPTVSSTVGMRGYHAVDGVHYVAADPVHFAEEVSALVDDREARITVGSNAWRLVRNDFDWGVLGGKLRRQFRSFLSGHQRNRPRRVLALTYRFGDASRGGAETFLSNVLEQLSENPDLDITVATTDVGRIQNQLLFSANYEHADSSCTDPAWAGDVVRFPVDPPPASLLESCRHLHATWMKESRALGSEFLHELPQASLAGGWNFPEWANGQCVRWTSSSAQVRIPPEARWVKVSLHAPGRTEITITQGGEVRATRVVEGDVELSADLLPKGGLMRIACDTLFHSEVDPRELGALVKMIVFGLGSRQVVVDLRKELDVLPQLVSLGLWVAALVRHAEKRSADLDARFLSVRGPNSAGLEMWLEANLHRFDVLLAQGIPFSTLPVGVEHARRAGVPVVALPHAHIEDRFYHWRAFYDAYKGADLTIAAPAASVDAFFKPIGARAKSLPGGGVSLAEFSENSLSRSREAFRGMYPTGQPFVLVLGRKADGKRYQRVLDAHKAIRARGIDIDLVMIGPDDDRVPVNGAGVHYFGPQPREVVLGALTDAVCLANMSESESFGIVLLEAWLAGTPVVANRSTASFEELVDDGVNGRLVGSDALLEEAISAYALDPNIAAQHARNGREKAEQYDWSILARSIAGCLNDVMSS